MTLTEITNMTYDLAVAGYVNGDKMTKAELKNCLKHWLADKQSSYIGEIVCQDGFSWFVKWSRDDHYYDFYIPDTREQNKVLEFELLKQGGIL